MLQQSATLTVMPVSSLYYATAQNKDIWAKPKPPSFQFTKKATSHKTYCNNHIIVISFVGSDIFSSNSSLKKSVTPFAEFMVAIIKSSESISEKSKS